MITSILVLCGQACTLGVLVTCACAVRDQVYHKLVPMCMPAPRWWAQRFMEDPERWEKMKAEDSNLASLAPQVTPMSR